MGKVECIEEGNYYRLVDTIRRNSVSTGASENHSDFRDDGEKGELYAITKNGKVVLYKNNSIKKL